MLHSNCKYLWLSPLLLLLALLSCSNSNDNATTPFMLSVTGKILDKQELGIPYALVEICIAGDNKTISTDITDSRGRFDLKSIPFDPSVKLIISCVHKDYQPLSESLNNLIQMQDHSNIKLHLNALNTYTEKLQISVFKDVDSSVLDSVEIKVFRNDSVYRTAFTLDTNFFCFTNISPGIYTVRFTRCGYSTKNSDIKINPSDSLSIAEYLSSIIK